MDTQPDERDATMEDEVEEAVEHLQAELATFTLIYESKDDRLCLFEDKQGHLHAVRASRLV